MTRSTAAVQRADVSDFPRGRAIILGFLLNLVTGAPTTGRGRNPFDVAAAEFGKLGAITLPGLSGPPGNHRSEFYPPVPRPVRFYLHTVGEAAPLLHSTFVYQIFQLVFTVEYTMKQGVIFRCILNRQARLIGFMLLLAFRTKYHNTRLSRRN